MLLSALAASAHTAAAVAGEETALRSSLDPKRLQSHGLPIVNGEGTHGYPSVVALFDQFGRTFCTGTLIGCQTVLTAAHCFCSDPQSGTVLPGTLCQGRADLLNPFTKLAFLQHAGIFWISSIAIHPGFRFAQASDLALVRLATPVEGIAPTPLNTARRPAPGSLGEVVGFGRGGGDLEDGGLKRAGLVTTAAGSLVPDATHLCWNFTHPLGAPGSDSSTCQGDSGGPLFVNFGLGMALGGVTSGGLPSCLPPNTPWDADVFLDRAWIQAQAGSDLANRTCGALAQAGEARAQILGGSGQLGAAEPRAAFTFEVPQDAVLLRIGLNGDDNTFGVPNNFDVFAKAGGEPTPADADCASVFPGIFDFCEVENPQPGRWDLLVQRLTGAAGFQVTATIFSPPLDTTPCTPGATTLCIDDQPGDKRFKVEVQFDSAQGGGVSGPGRAIPLSSLGVNQGGLFWFFNPGNPEILVKILNGCAVNGRYWIFYSAGTNVGFEVTVTDTHNGGGVAERQSRPAVGASRPGDQRVPVQQPVARSTRS